MTTTNHQRPTMPRIGLLSDTHGVLHPEIPGLLAGCDLILHAGDIGGGTLGHAILDALEAVAPTVAVSGNIDDPSMRRRVPAEVEGEIGGVRYVMTHIGGHPKRWAPGVGARLAAVRPGLFVTGHSHILRVERVASLGGMLYVNPGACGVQGFHLVRTLVRLSVDGGKATSADVVHLE